MAIDEAAHPLVGQKQNGLRDIGRRSEPPHWHATDNVIVGVAARGLISCIHLGFDPAGTDQGKRISNLFNVNALQKLP